MKLRGCLVLMVLLSTSMVVATGQHKTFLIDKTYEEASGNTYGNHSNANAVQQSFSPRIMTAFSKKCPEILFTTDRSGAEFVLNPQVGGSVLTSKAGDVLYISPARTLGNMVKDICAYVSKH